jgi:hypothetical protein
VSNLQTVFLSGNVKTSIRRPPTFKRNKQLGLIFHPTACWWSMIVRRCSLWCILSKVNWPNFRRQTDSTKSVVSFECNTWVKGQYFGHVVFTNVHGAVFDREYVTPGGKKEREHQRMLPSKPWMGVALSSIYAGFDNDCMLNVDCRIEHSRHTTSPTRHNTAAHILHTGHYHLQVPPGSDFVPDYGPNVAHHVFASRDVFDNLLPCA